MTRIALRNYKSIAACDVQLAPLSFLVGPNGCGKSNFLDALRFVAEALRFSLDHALRDRGGIQEVRRRSGGHPNHFGIRLDLQLPCAVGWYALQGCGETRWSLQRPAGGVLRRSARSGHGSYKVADGKVGLTARYPIPRPAPATASISSTCQDWTCSVRLYDAQSGMGFYNLNPDAIRDLQAPDPGDLLKRDGSNLASVLSNPRRHSKNGRGRIPLSDNSRSHRCCGPNDGHQAHPRLPSGGTRSQASMAVAGQQYDRRHATCAWCPWWRCFRATAKRWDAVIW